MISLLVLIVGFSFIYLGRIWFGKWFNHLTIYSLIWMTMLYLYELGLIYFVTLSVYTWLVIIGAFLSFVFGILTLLSARGTLNLKSQATIEQLKLFTDDGKTLKYTIYFFSIIGLLAALQHWNVLLSKYGTVINVFLNAYHIYQERVSGQLEGVIPYIWLIIYPAICLAGIYTAYKRKLTFVALLPLIALVLKESANLSRAGMLFGLSEFIASFFTTPS